MMNNNNNNRRRRNAVIIAFVAQLLHVEKNSRVEAARTSGVAKAVSPLSSSISSLSRRPVVGCAGFVHHCDNRGASSQNRRRSCPREKVSPRILERPVVGSNDNKLANLRSVAPRYYVTGGAAAGGGGDGPTSNAPLSAVEVAEGPSNSASSEVGTASDVIVYPNLFRDNNNEFSLLRPTLEFNELDLQELFAQKKGGLGRRARDNKSSVATVEPSSTSSQLYDQLEEVEITGHWHRRHREQEKRREEEEAATARNPFFFASIPREKQQQPQTAPTQPATATVALPPWLSLNQSRFAPMKLRKLQRDLTSHLSTKDIDTVVHAIHIASNGDLKKVAGTSDFCSILVNYLEITDVPALCASAFHYSSLVTVREREVMTKKKMKNNDSDSSNFVDLLECSIEEEKCLHEAGADAKYLCALAGSGIETFGTHAVKIALDAARLKSMEMLASAVVGRTRNSNELDSHDARNLRSLLLSVNEMGDWRALAIRSAACLYRLEGLEAHRLLLSTTTAAGGGARIPTSEESRASQEALHIYAPLAARLGMFRLKTELEDAAFRTLYPHSHAFVSALCGGENTNSVGEGMKSVLSDITNQMKRVLQEDTFFMENIENMSVMTRVKEPYSVWRKIHKMSKEKDRPVRSFSILDVPDAVALRVVFSARKLTPDEPDATTQRREREMCYYVLELCRRNWPEMSDSRFKDYVKNPKENGYQSLHYSSRKRWRGTEWPFEVQIRSSDMHRVAEYGIASHWSYKQNDIDKYASSSSKTITAAPRLARSSESYLRSVDEWRRKQAERSYVDPDLMEPAQYLEDEIRRQRKLERDQTLAPYLEALSGAQTDMTRENVFVFVLVRPPSSINAPAAPTEGTVVSLPRGSRVLDAIRVAEKWSSTLESGGGNLYDGRNSFVALRNGLRISSMGSERLDNGDIVSIFPSEELVVSKRKRSSVDFQ